MKIRNQEGQLIDTKFKFGNIVMTQGIASWLNIAEVERIDKVTKCVYRHLTCDWGELDDEDKQVNEDALKYDGRLLSEYTVDDRVLYIITEADRTLTTILFCEEY